MIQTPTLTAFSVSDGTASPYKYLIVMFNISRHEVQYTEVTCFFLMCVVVERGNSHACYLEKGRTNRQQLGGRGEELS